MNTLNRNNLTELRSFATPPTAVLYKFDIHLHTKACLTYLLYGNYIYMRLYTNIFRDNFLYCAFFLVLHGFYGNDDKHIGVTSDFTLKVIEHLHGVINRYIKEDVRTIILRCFFLIYYF